MVETVSRLERPLAWSIAALAMLHYVLFFTDAYAAWYPFDMFMHFACGAWFGVFGFHFLFLRGRAHASSAVWKAVIVVSFVALVGVLWEFHEFIGDRFITDPALVMQSSVADTMSDLLFDILGGTIAVILAIVWQKRSRLPEGKG